MAVGADRLLPDASLGPSRRSFLSPDPEFPPDLRHAIAVRPGTLEDRIPPEYGKATWMFRIDGDRISLRKWMLDGRQVISVDSPDFMGHAEGVFDSRLVTDTCDIAEHAWISLFGIMPLAIRLLRHGGMIFHGAALRIGGEGVLCLGVSGRGKSTISRLSEDAGETAFCDERPAVRRLGDGSFRLCGTPWRSSGRYAKNISAPLRRVFFLEHGPANEIVPLRPSQALLELRKVAVIAWQHPALFDPALGTAGALVESVPCAILRFLPDQSAIDALRRDLETRR